MQPSLLGISRRRKSESGLLTPGQGEDSYVLYGLVVTNGCRIRAHRFFIAESSNAQTELP